MKKSGDEIPIRWCATAGGRKPKERESLVKAETVRLFLEKLSHLFGMLPRRCSATRVATAAALPCSLDSNDLKQAPKCVAAHPRPHLQTLPTHPWQTTKNEPDPVKIGPRAEVFAEGMICSGCG